MNRTNDVVAVKKVIGQYMQGTRDRNVNQLKAVFHKNAIMSGNLGPILLLGSPEPFYNHLESHPHSDNSYDGEVTHVSVVGHIATAQLVEENLYGMSFVNYFHLLNINGDWIVVSKLFHHD